MELEKQLDEKTLKKITTMTMQSVRHLNLDDILYAIYFTKGFKKIGWMAEIDGKYYGATSDLVLNAKQKDDIIDYYLAMDKNAQDTIKAIREKKD